MINSIFSTIVTFIISTLLGYCISLIKQYKNKITNNKKNDNIQNIALRSLLKSQLTNTYFVYNELRQIPDYVYKNFLDMLEVYEALNGNGFVHTLADKMKTWEIVKTDIL